MITSGLTAEKALQYGNAQLWREAIISQVESLNSYHVFHRMEKVTSKIIPTKFVLVRKLNEKGNLEHYKARLAVQGFFQRSGFDFDIESTYTLTIHLTVLQLLLTIAVSVKLEIW